MRLRGENSCIRSDWLKAVLIAFVIMLVYFLVSSRTTLWDRDEPRFARATVEMIESGNYLIPTFNGKLRPDKPILIYWLMSLPIRLLGPTEFACRFFSVIGTVVSCLLTFYIGQRLLGAMAGLWAMIILASTLMMLYVGSAATADAVLLSCMIVVMAVFVHTFDSKTHVLDLIIMGVCFGLAFLAKGPVGLLPIPIIIITLLLSRKDERIAGRPFLRLVGAVIVGILIFLTWAIPANNATDGEFLRLGIGHHVLGRTIEPLEYHGGNFLLYLPYYVFVVLVAFFPWTVYLPGALSAVLGGRIGGRRCRALLISWMALIFIIMTFISTKLPHYVLFMWPALAIVVAGTIVAAEKDKLTKKDLKWLQRGVWFFVPVTIVIALVLIMIPWFLPKSGLNVFGFISGILLLAIAAIVIWKQYKCRVWESAKVLVVGMVVLQIPVLFGVLPAIEHLKISPVIAKAVTENTSKEVPVATYQYDEPTLNFYIGRRIETLANEMEVVSWSKESKAGVLIIPRDELNSIQQRYDISNLEEFALKEGLNYSIGRFLEVVALARITEKL